MQLIEDGAQHAAAAEERGPTRVGTRERYRMVAAVGCLERRAGSARRPGRPVEGVDARLEQRRRDSLPQQARALVRWHDAAHDEVAVARERGQLAR